MLAGVHGPCANSSRQIQTTFTPFHSQDPNNCPYDPEFGIAEQVDASVQISRRNFADPTTNSPGYLDAVILHDLYPSADETVEVWKSLSTHMGQASVRRLGLSNVDKSDLESVHDLHYHHPTTFTQPKVVQNRFHQENDYDAEVRAICKAAGITYQTFGVRANSNMLNHQTSIVTIADRANVSREAALYGILMYALGRVADDQSSLDVQVIVGTSKPARMAVLEEVRKVLMRLNDAHGWTATYLQQRRDSELEHDWGDERTGGSQESNAYRLARHAFLVALGTEN